MEMTLSQKEHYKTVKWLLDPMGPRAVGKTQLMSLAFIEHSVNHNEWVRIYDHIPTFESSREILRRISLIVSREMKGYNLTIRNVDRLHPEILVYRIKDKKE